jgi:hypothetical protein
VNLARTIGLAGPLMPPWQLPADAVEEEGHEARAERSLAHISEILERRQRWRRRARVLALALVPLALMLFARQARGVL